jgi:stearoyl-CoA desaturase (Delta-9 desaturase)
MMSQATAPPDVVLPGDAEAIMERALREEAPTRIRGVHEVTREEIRFQRRMAVLFTVLPLLAIVLAAALAWGGLLHPVDAGLFLGFYVFTGLGVTVGYHRLFTHRSFDAPALLRKTLAVAGTMAAQGAIIDWVATHRRHHAYADEYGDPHSPHLVERSGLRGVLRGLWHAHMGWLFAPDGTDNSRWAPDLEAEPFMAAVNRRAPRLVTLSLVLPAVLGGVLTGTLFGAFTGFLWGGAARVFVLHHMTWSINSICHFFGTQPFQSRDESTNNWPLALFTFGESWHNNHHAFPSSARHGLLRGQVDISWRVIRTLEQLRVVRNVRLPSATAVARKWADRPRTLAR